MHILCYYNNETPTHYRQSTRKTIPHHPRQFEDSRSLRFRIKPTKRENIVELTEQKKLGRHHSKHTRHKQTSLPRPCCRPVARRYRCQEVPLPGGTAEDYELHINDSIDCVTDEYCKFYSTNFEDIHRQIVANISKTMTDRASMNHATVHPLEQNWRKPLNELNCHLHPLDTIASSVRSVIKTNEPDDLVKKLFGSDCIAYQLVLAINKF